jgi:NAD(P)H dehydrogenase (quinone)
MNWLIISCNPNPNSFSQGIDSSIKEVIGANDEVLSYNLYDINFDPILSFNEYNDCANFRHKTKETLDKDILKEIENIVWADIIIFIYPIWWMQMPAMIKGYFDRVFMYGYLLKNLTNLYDKQIISFVSAGLSEAEQKQKKIDSAYDVILNDFIYFFTGKRGILKIFSNINKVDENTRKTYLEEVKIILKNTI